MAGKYDLTSINASLFTLGMFIRSNVYIEKGGSIILCFGNSMINDDILNRIKEKKLQGYRFLMDRTEYAQIMEDIEEQKAATQKTAVTPKSAVHRPAEPRPVESKPLDRDNVIMAAVDYERLISGTRMMFDSVLESEEVPLEITEIMSADISEKVKHLSASTILQSINRARNIDEYLYDHSVNVGFINGLFGKWLKLSEAETDKLIQVGLLHDVGKLKVPPEILNKPSRLTREEFDEMKRHSVYSYDTIINTPGYDPIVAISVLHHHEKAAGNGYPSGLKLDEIPIFSRVTAISDVYDAMIAKRSYKKAFSPFAILNEFSKGRFSDLDMKLVNIFLELIPMELVGREVLMSNGEIAEVVYVSSTNFLYPLVKLDGEVKPTDEKFYVISLYEQMR